METLDIIRREHRLILELASVLDRMARPRHDLPETWETDLARVLEFFRVFVDLCHHGKEEMVLFPALGENGVVEEDGPIGLALDQHEALRTYLDEIGEALSSFRRWQSGALSKLRLTLSGFSDLCRTNIRDEENRLLPAAEQVLNRRELKAIDAAFTALEAEHLRPQQRLEFRRMIQEVPRRYLDIGQIRRPKVLAPVG